MASFQHFYNGSTDLGLIIGSPFCGNPISVKVKSKFITLTSDNTLSFHRLIIEVKAGITGGNYITQEFSTSVSDDQETKDGETVEVDISSALRSVAEEYEYTPYACTYPRISFQVSAYDTYRLDGDVYDKQEQVYLPTSETYYYALIGQFSDMERLLAGGLKKVYDFCRKPATTPQIVYVGETFAYTNTFVGNEADPTQPVPTSFRGYTFDNLPCGPTSILQDVLMEGSQQIGDVNLYALPEDERPDDRYEFRFINRLGVLDSYACTAYGEVNTEITQNEYSLTTQESFSTFSRGIIRKSGDKETIKLTSGALDRAWADWFTHEFLMAERVWIRIYTDSSKSESVWVRCHIVPDETVKGINRQSSDLITIDFSVKLDITGSINSALLL